MADAVQYYLEQQISELEDLDRKGLFSKTELRKIVKERTKYEYALKRRIARKEDFLRYIEYELNLDRIRKDRKSKLPKKEANKISLSDYAIVRKVHFLFDRALTKFGGDVNLWLQFFAFANQGESRKSAHSIIGRALQFHPTNPSLWIVAAEYEVTVTSNTTAARALFQRGLRHCGTSPELWLAYHRMEVHYADKIRRRRRVLGIDADSERLVETGGSIDESGDDMIRLPHFLSGETDDKVEAESERSDDHNKENILRKKRPKTAEVTGLSQTLLNENNSNPFLNGAIARIVYTSAIHAIPLDFDFRLKLLENYTLLIPKSPAAVAGAEEVYESLKNDFPDKAQAYSVVAQRHMVGRAVGGADWSDALRKTVQEFSCAVQLLKTAQMHEERCQFLKKMVNTSKGESLRDYVTQCLTDAYSEATEAHPANIPLLTARITFVANRLRDPSKAVALATEFVRSDGGKTSPLLWLAYANIETETANKGKIFEDALQMVPGSKELWENYLDWVVESAKAGYLNDERVKQVFERALKHPCVIRSSELSNLIHSRHLTYVSTLPEGLTLFRTIAKSLSFPTPALYKHCIALECALPSDHFSHAHASNFAERLLLLDNKNVEHWILLMRVHVLARKLVEAGRVVQRARLALPEQAYALFEQYWKEAVSKTM